MFVFLGWAGQVCKFVTLLGIVSFCFLVRFVFLGLDCAGMYVCVSWSGLYFLSGGSGL